MQPYIDEVVMALGGMQAAARAARLLRQGDRKVIEEEGRASEDRFDLLLRLMREEPELLRQSLRAACCNLGVDEGRVIGLGKELARRYSYVYVRPDTDLSTALNDLQSTSEGLTFDDAVEVASSHCGVAPAMFAAYARTFTTFGYDRDEVTPPPSTLEDDVKRGVENWRKPLSPVLCDRTSDTYVGGLDADIAAVSLAEDCCLMRDALYRISEEILFVFCEKSYVLPRREAQAALESAYPDEKQRHEAAITYLAAAIPDIVQLGRSRRRIYFVCKRDGRELFRSHVRLVPSKELPFYLYMKWFWAESLYACAAFALNETYPRRRSEDWEGSAVPLDGAEAWELLGSVEPAAIAAIEDADRKKAMESLRRGATAKQRNLLSALEDSDSVAEAARRLGRAHSTLSESLEVLATRLPEPADLLEVRRPQKTTFKRKKNPKF